jgi:multidrug efflux system membrane fusion protein
VTVQLGEGEETVSHSGVAQEAVIAEAVSKSKRMLATLLAAILAPGVFFALRTGKHEEDTPITGEGKKPVIVHTGRASQDDMGVYVDALGTVTPVSTVNIYSQRCDPAQWNAGICLRCMSDCRGPLA